MNTIVTVVVGLLTLSAVAGATVAVARSAYARATIEELKNQNEALRDGNTDCKTRIEALERRAEVLEKENDTLRGVVTGKAELEDLKARLMDHHREALAHVDNIRDELRRFGSLVEALSTTVEDSVGQVLGMLHNRRGPAHGQT